MEMIPSKCFLRRKKQSVQEVVTSNPAAPSADRDLGSPLSDAGSP